MKHWQIIADDLATIGWTWVCVSTVGSGGRTICIIDAHRGDGKRFVVRADEKLTAFVELQRAIHEFAGEFDLLNAIQISIWTVFHAEYVHMNMKAYLWPSMGTATEKVCG